MVTCPSAISTTLLSLRTHRTVVPCICALSSLFGIPPLYTRGRLYQQLRLSLGWGGDAGPSVVLSAVLATERTRRCVVLSIARRKLWPSASVISTQSIGRRS